MFKWLKTPMLYEVCFKCMHHFEPRTGKTVLSQYVGSGSGSATYHTYCKEHAPKWDIEVLSSPYSYSGYSYSGSYPRTYYRIKGEFECNEEGQVYGIQRPSQ